MILNSQEFLNKKIIVTGSSTGIGMLTAIEYLRLGAKVIFHGNKSLNNLNNKLNEFDNSRYKILKSDFTDVGQVEDFMKQSLDFLQGLDILVNNAGTMIGRYHLEEISTSKFEEIFNLNAKSAYFASKSALDQFKKQNYGCIINVSTISASTGGSAGSSAYSASKSFISGITRSLASELAPYNIRVNAISPGTINTKFHEQYSSKEKLENTRLKIPLKRLGEPEDCVGPIIFLSSNSMSSYITGQILEINGGQFIS
tara:strand:+ start:2695 stop:3462 length:768 start_codon:yes stop_codon:yes gene_type:complete